IDLLKIDAEGCEAKIIQGAHRIIENNQHIYSFQLETEEINKIIERSLGWQKLTSFLEDCKILLNRIKIRRIRG
ncbi:MAG: hypothetical protein EOP45_21935, partial [Sphingobacteriaceae bacterium]